MEERVRMLLAHLRERAEVPASELAERFSVSERTIRTYVREARRIVGGTASIFSDNGAYHLVIVDEGAFEALLARSEGQGDAIPQTQPERVTYLLRSLPARDGWVTLDELSSELFVSRHSVSNALKPMESILADFGLSLLRRPRYGIRVEGPEEGRRLCLASIDTVVGGSEVSREAWALAGLAIAVVGEAFALGFECDVELRVNLARHIERLVERLRSGSEAENPLLDDIKARYPLAHAMACSTADTFRRHIGAKPSEAELGFLALAFELALERRREGASRKRILVVCATGRTSSRMLAERFERAFGEVVGSVRVCDVSEVAVQDLSDVDYLFTTVPLPVGVPVPVCRIDYFFEGESREELDSILSGTDGLDVSGYFDRELFLSHPGAVDRDAVLRLLCDRLVGDGIADERLYDFVATREETSSTSIGNGIAMPHPLQAVGERTAIAVCLLDEPVVWDGAGHLVEAVFLVSFGTADGPRLEALFDRLADYFLDDAAVARLLEARTLDQLLLDLS